MFTAKPQKNRSTAGEYFDEHLAQNDYYAQGEKQAGYWIGQGAERLGLKSGETVGRDEFLKLCDNQHPQDGTKLTQVHFKDRRVFFDFTCSAPKSVSILGLTMDGHARAEKRRTGRPVQARGLSCRHADFQLLIFPVTPQKLPDF